MTLIKKENYLPVRRPIKPGLLNHEFIEKYLETYGNPDCYCCNESLELFVPARAMNTLRLYCVNCALTIVHIGVCQHG